MAGKPRAEVLRFFKREKVISFYSRLYQSHQNIKNILMKIKALEKEEGGRESSSDSEIDISLN